MAKTKHSKNYEKVRTAYLTGLWCKTWFDNSVGKWLTQEEHDEIEKEKENLVPKGQFLLALL